MTGMRLVLLSAIAASSHGLCASGAPPRAAARKRTSPPVMASWTPADMSAKRQKLPEQVDELLSDDTSRREVEILWAALRSCFASEEEAIAAASRNTGTILPYLNSPSNIYGCFEVLVELLGRDAAASVCAKNPGILQCNPRVLAREKPEKIIQAADTVDFFEGALGALPPALRQNLDKLAFIALALPVAKRVADCAGQTCGLS